MAKATLTTAAAIGVIGALMTSPARAKSAGGTDAEIALLKKQLRCWSRSSTSYRNKGRRVRPTAANANAKAKADVKAATVANAAYPAKASGCTA